jgi:hypothetical protein
MDLALEVILFYKPMLMSDLPASIFRALGGSRRDLERGGAWLDREWWPDTYGGLMSIRRLFTETHDIRRPWKEFVGQRWRRQRLIRVSLRWVQLDSRRH